MTRDADFKRLVRRRMSRTGEPYALARARLVGLERTGASAPAAPLGTPRGEGRSIPMQPFERLSDAAKSVLLLAQDEAERSGDAHVGTEHLLIALLRGPRGVARRVLEGLGIELGRVREQVRTALDRDATTSGEARPATDRGPLPTPRLKRVLEQAFAEADRQRAPEVDTEHLLIGLLRDGQGLAAHVLVDAGATLEGVWNRLGRAALELGSLDRLDLDTMRRQALGHIVAASPTPLIELPGAPIASITPELVGDATMRELAPARGASGPQGQGRAAWSFVPVQVTISASVASDAEWVACLPAQREPLDGIGDTAYVVSEGHVLLVRSGRLVLQVRALGVQDTRRTLIGLAAHVLARLEPVGEKQR